jgi:hypothetical protein
MPAEWIERLSLRGEQLTFCLAKAYLADLLTPTETPALAAGATVGVGTQRSKTLSRAETLSEAETHGTNWSHTHTEADTVGEADTVSETDSHSTGTSGSRGTSDESSSVRELGRMSRLVSLFHFSCESNLHV